MTWWWCVYTAALLVTGSVPSSWNLPEYKSAKVNEVETKCRKRSEARYGPGSLSLLCLSVWLLSPLFANGLPFPSALPLLHVFPARLDVVIFQASQECLQMFSLWQSQTRTQSLLDTFPFLCTHKWSEADVVMSSGGRLCLTSALKALLFQLALILMHFHKRWTNSHWQQIHAWRIASQWRRPIYFSLFRR